MSGHLARRILRSMVLAAVASTVISSTVIIGARGWTGFLNHNAPLSIVWVGSVGLITWLASGKSDNMLVRILALGVFTNGLYLVGEALRLVLDPDGPLNIAVDNAVPADMPPRAALAVSITLALASSGSSLFNVFALLLFPDGRLPSRRWRPIGVVVVVGAIWTFVVNLVVWHPSSTVLPGEHPLWGFGSWFDLIGFPLALLGLAARYRNAPPKERAQIKLVLWGACIFLPSVLIGSLAGSPPVLVGGAVVLVATYGVAIVRHSLFDVDMVISRTLAYATLAALIGSVYVAVVVGIGSLLGSGDEPNPVLAIAATALVAVAFQPARLRLQGLANRLVFGRRATPYEVLSDFSRGVAATNDSLLADAARSLVEGTAAERVVVTLDLGGDTIEAAAWPEDVGSDISDGREAARFPITESGSRLGTLEMFVAAGQILSDGERRLAQHLASGMGLALGNQALSERLAVRVDELRQSQRRLVAVQDEARRRLERDLHDGAQQQLVALKVKLGLCRSLVDDADNPDVAERIDRLADDADEAVESLRDFARGVYPSLLEAEGLEVALGAQVRRSGVPVELDAVGLGRYPREVESTVYFCVLEALGAVAERAEASRARVRLAQHNGSLMFEIHDDGLTTGPSLRAIRSGLSRVEDRLDALSGVLDVNVGPGDATTVAGIVPTGVVAS